MAKMYQTRNKLLGALNSRGQKLTFSTKEFIGTEGNTHKYYTISQGVWNDERRRYDHHELYSSVSMVRIVLFLRDRWFEINGWELPTDQKQWNDIRQKLKEDNDG